jgi:hypothetical protein
MQVELDALDPDDLQALYQTAVDRYWDTSAYEQVIRDEDAGRARLRAMIAGMDNGQSGSTS